MHTSSPKVSFTSSPRAIATARGTVLAPRCGRTLTRYEPAGWPAVLEDPVCGRPAGHPPAADGGSGCRSEQSMARIRQNQSARTPNGSPGMAALVLAARTTAGMSQRDFAAAIGTSQRRVGEWEKAFRDPSDRMLGRIAEVVSQRTGQQLRVA